MRRAVPALMAALFAPVRDNISPPRVGLDLNGAHYAAAFGGPVPGVDVDVERAQAARTVIARRVT